jgi:hypothetical protein
VKKIAIKIWNKPVTTKKAKPVLEPSNTAIIFKTIDISSNKRNKWKIFNASLFLMKSKNLWAKKKIMIMLNNSVRVIEKFL